MRRAKAIAAALAVLYWILVALSYRFAVTVNDPLAYSYVPLGVLTLPWSWLFFWALGQLTHFPAVVGLLDTLMKPLTILAVAVNGYAIYLAVRARLHAEG